MDHGNESGGVYAAEKIIRKRVKKVNPINANTQNPKKPHTHIKFRNQSATVQLFMFSCIKSLLSTSHCRHLCLIKRETFLFFFD